MKKSRLICWHFFVISLLLLAGMVWAKDGEFVLAMGKGPAPPSSKGEASAKYGYYYKGNFVALNASKQFVAIEENGVSIETFVRANDLRRDHLSDKESLKRRNLVLYRLPKSKKKAATRLDLNAQMKSFAKTTYKVVQPVFEQGQALLIPSDEVIVGLKEDTSFDQAEEYLEPYLGEQGILEIRKHRKNTYILKIDNPSDGRAYEVCQFLATLDKVQFAEPNHIVVRLPDPNYLSKLKINGTISKEKMVVLDTGEQVAPGQELAPGSSSFAPPNWSVIASLDLESPTFPPGGWELGWSVGATEATWGRTSYISHGGSYSIYCALEGPAGVSPPGPVPTNMFAILRSPLVDLSSYEEIYVEIWFYAKNDLWPGPGGDLYDYPAVVVIDNDTGSASGMIMGTIANGDCTVDPTTANGWRKLLFRVPPTLRVTNAFFDIWYVSDSIDQFEGAYLDDIRIVGTIDVDTEFISNDTYSARQYELRNVGQIAGLGNDSNDMEVPEAWSQVSVSPDVVVAVIDDGVELDHPDLNTPQGYNWDGTPGGGPQNEYDNHGTACAGNVGAIRNNGIGVVGIAPNVKIMPVHLDWEITHFATAIDVAVQNGADVLSNSWGWYDAPAQDIENAINDALAAGRVVVFAAGNGPDRPPWTYDVAFPGNLTGSIDVICVGASSLTDEHKGAASSDGGFYWGSSYVGDGPDVCAPSPWSYSTDRQGAAGYNDGSLIDPADPSSADYTPTFGGTSSSTPKVAGVAALLLSECPQLTPAQVKSILRDTADDIDAPGVDDKTGGGRVNAYEAVLAAREICGGQPPCVENDSGALDVVGANGNTGSTVIHTVRIQGAPNTVDSLGFEVTYDPSILEYTGNYSRGDCVAGFDYFDCTEPEVGAVRCGGFTTQNAIPQGANCDVVDLEFIVLMDPCDPGACPGTLELQALVDDLVDWSTSHGCFCCGCSCDVNGDGEVTPVDALCAFQKYLGICPTDCGDCEEICCDVTQDDDCTPADALEIFKEYLGMDSVCSAEPVE